MKKPPKKPARAKAVQDDEAGLLRINLRAAPCRIPVPRGCTEIELIAPRPYEPLGACADRRAREWEAAGAVIRQVPPKRKKGKR